MPAYALAGLVLDADLPLPELGEPAPGPGDRPWSVRRADTAALTGLRTLAELRTTLDVLRAVIEGAPGGYRLTYPSHAVFEIDLGRRAVTYVPTEGTPEVTIRHLLIDQVLPYLLVADGAFALHASCVAVDGRAIAFVGPSGAGKSSMAAAFVRHGGTLLSDDVVVLDEDGDGYVVTPAYPSLRLWEDSAEHFSGQAAEELPQVADYTVKRRWSVPEAGPTRWSDRVPLAAIVGLGARPEPGQPDCRIGRIRGADAFIVVCEQGFRLERSGRAQHDADLERYGRLVERVPVHLVEYRRDYDLLPGVRDAILGAAGLGRG